MNPENPQNIPPTTPPVPEVPPPQVPPAPETPQLPALPQAPLPQLPQAPPVPQMQTPQPFTQQPMQPQPNLPQNNYPAVSSSGSKNKLVIIIAVVVGLLVIGGGVYAVTQHGSSNKYRSGVIGKDIDAKQDGSVGDTLKANGLEIGISSIDQKAQLDEYTKAESGKTYMIANVSIKNGTKDTVSVLPNDFKMNTSDKRIVTGQDYYGASNNLPEDALAAGGSAQGVVVFEVDPATAQSINYTYTQYPKDTSKDVYHYDFTFKIK